MKPKFFIPFLAVLMAAVLFIAGCSGPGKQPEVKIPQICQQLSGEKIDSCVFSFAKSTKNETLCPAAGGLNYSCYRALSLLKKDASLCEKTHPEMKGNCYFDVAVETQDGSLCEKSESRRDYCYSRISLDLNSPVFCNKAGAEKEACYYGVAYATKNASLCESAGSLKESCYANIIQTNSS